MPFFYQVTSPTLNGVDYAIDRDDEHQHFKNWLSQNYPNFDPVSFDATIERRKTYDDDVPIICWKPTETGGYSVGVYQNIPGTHNNYDAEFLDYANFYNSHPSWTTPGSIVELIIENEADVPAEWLDFLYYYWPGN
jgi:hypothetical protein